MYILKENGWYSYDIFVTARMQVVCVGNGEQVLFPGDREVEIKLTKFPFPYGLPIFVVKISQPKVYFPWINDETPLPL